MARTFNGTSDQIAFGSDAACDDLAAFTAYALVRPTANIADERQILTKMDSSFFGKMFISAFNLNQIGCYLNRTGGVDCYAFSTNDALVVNSWNVAVVTWAGSGSTPVLYTCVLGGTLTAVTNSTQIGSGTFISDASATLRVGARDAADATFYAGGVANAALWNRVLSSTERGELGLGNSPELVPSGLVFSSRITGTDSPEINTTGGTNGTVTGTSFLAHPTVNYGHPRRKRQGGVPGMKQQFSGVW